MEINTVLEKMVELKIQIDDILRSSTYDEHADLSGLHVDRKDSDQLFLLKELRSIMRKLADTGCSIEYIFRPVREVGSLHQNEGGEYVAGQGYPYRSGSLIEVLLQDDSHEVPCWTLTKVEHDGEDYYLVGYEEIPMEGLNVRVR